MAEGPVPTPVPAFVPPGEGELIIALETNNTYRIGRKIGEGSFGVVYECTDTWNNELAVKVLKPLGTYEQIRDSAIAERHKLLLLRHPNIIYVYDAFEYRHTFYIVFERCWKSIMSSFKEKISKANYGCLKLPAKFSRRFTSYTAITMCIRIFMAAMFLSLQCMTTWIPVK